MHNLRRHDRLLPQKPTPPGHEKCNNERHPLTHNPCLDLIPLAHLLRQGSKDHARKIPEANPRLVVRRIEDLAIDALILWRDEL